MPKERNMSSRSHPRRAVAVAVLGSVLAVFAGAASATAPPVGPLPKGPQTTITAPRGTYVSVSVPKPSASTGNVWRVARRYDTNVVRQVSEQFVGNVLVLVFKTVRPGTTSIVLAKTHGETRKALAASYFRVSVV
jgi:hypothetical protein